MKIIIASLVIILLSGGLFYSEYQSALIITERDKILERVAELEEIIETDKLIKEIVVNELNFPPGANDRIEKHLRNVRKVIDEISSLFGDDKFVALRYFQEYQNCVNKLPAFVTGGEGGCLSKLQENLSLHY